MADSQNTQILDQRVGIIDGLDADRKRNTWYKVTFSNSFAEGKKVVVIPMTQTYFGSETPGLRIQNVTNSGFEIQRQLRSFAELLTQSQAWLGVERLANYPMPAI